MKICILSLTFPTEHSISFMFLEQLCREFVEMGHEVTVITRQSITKHIIRGTKYSPSYYEVRTKSDNVIKVHMPKIWTFGNTSFSIKSFNRSAYIKLKKLGYKPDLVYGHFWESAYAGYKYAKEFSIPLFVACGEDYITLQNYITPRNLQGFSNLVKGAVCVSSKSRNESVSVGLLNEKNTQSIIIPNAINPNLFKKLDKNFLRNKYNFGKDDFIVIFVGQFCERKGVNRICQALEQINRPNIKAIFVGSGAEKPWYKNTIFCDSVPHDVLPEYLNCADVFLLPTLSEGCCNAMIEALACGLPVISSDRDFNWDVLDESNSILIEPQSICDIKSAILKVYNDNKFRENLSKGALLTASKLTLKERANKIISFINSIL